MMKPLGLMQCFLRRHRSGTTVQSQFAVRHAAVHDRVHGLERDDSQSGTLHLLF